jgi:hypothetical protein
MVQRGTPRRRRRPERGRRTQRASSNQSTLLIAIGGGAVVVLIVLFMVLRSGRAPLPETVTETKREAPPPDPNVAKRREALQWFETTFYDVGVYRELSSEAIEARMAEADQRGYDKIPGLDWDKQKKLVYSALLRREPLDPAANRALGRIPLSDYPDFGTVYRRMQDVASLPEEFVPFRNECEEKIQTRPVFRTHVLSPEEFAKATALLDRFRAWDDAMRSDPLARAIYRARARVAADPLLGTFETVHMHVPPFLVFYASRALVPKDESAAEKARIEKEGARLRARLETYRKLIERYLQFFRKTWIEPLGLGEFGDDQLLYVWIFGERESWEKYGDMTGSARPPGMLGYFNPQDSWIYLYEDAKERLTVESSLAHEMTHQLHWFYSASKDDKDEFLNHFGRIDAVWFTEGWAEYAGWTAHKGDDYVFAQTSAERVRCLRWLE